ncbi:DUF1987 domain-containing protein [Bacteroidota bacterium]
MEKYFVQGNSKMPTVTVDPEKGLLEISGNSIPEDAGGFYKPIVDSLNEYFKNPQYKTVVNINLSYFNSASQKWLLNILKLFKFLPVEGNEVVINWYYDKNDEEMFDTIDDFKSLLELPINVIESLK